MWKFVRNMVLLTAALAGALYLLLWVAAQQQAGAIAAQLAPWVDLRYGGASSGFDGMLHLSDASIQPRHGPLAQDPLHADELRIRAGGPLWLLSRAVSRSDTLPPEVRIEASGVSLPKGLTTATAGWLNPRSHIPFDDFGCGSALTDKDYAAMQRLPQALNASLVAQRDAAAQELQLDLRVEQTPLASLRFRADLKPFDFAALDDAKALSALRVASASLDYRDQGYFAARSRRCAERLGGSVEGYLDRHLAAVTEYLTAHDVVPVKEVQDLYRQMLIKGGDIELVSLPNAAVAPASYGERDRAEVLRYLNLTARHDQSPPILFKLNFLAPALPEESALTVAAGAATAPTATTTVTATPTPVPATPPSAPVTPAPEPAKPAPAVATTTAAPPAASPPKPVVATPSSTATVVATPAPVATPKPAPQTPAVASTTAAPAPTPAAPDEKLRDPATGRPLPSIEAPQGENTTLALIWKGGTIERLPAKEAGEKPYTVVPPQALETYVGQRLTLVTEGGKELEGTLSSVDSEEAVLQMRRQTGSAALNVPRKRIREVHVPRPLTRE